MGRLERKGFEMSPEELENLGRRAVACKGWCWMPGMKLLSGGTGEFPAWGWPDKDSGWLPDFSDPVTLGCLLPLVRGEFVDYPGLHARPSTSGGWEVIYRLGSVCIIIGVGPTEAAALVVALEASS